MVILVLGSQRDDFTFDIFVALFSAVHHLSSFSVFGEFPTMCLGGEHCLQKVIKTVTQFF